MTWKLDKNRPLCPQIVEQLCVGIASGELKPRERLLSVREVALAAGVNPNTVQKSFEQLEAQGLIYSVRGSGWYVEDNREAAVSAVQDLVRQKTADYLAAMALLGQDKAAVKTYLEEWCQ